MDDFYVVLPSNACPNVHPNNTANKYVVSWQNPLLFEGMWKVALTEINFNYTAMSINGQFGIEYEKLHQIEHAFEFPLTIHPETNTLEYERHHKFPTPKFPPHDAFTQINVKLKNKKLLFYSFNKFGVSFKGLSDAKMCGFASLSENSTFVGGYFVLEALNEYKLDNNKEAKDIEHIII